MQPPMMGVWNIQVQAVNPFAIHGDQYYELKVSRVDAPADVASIKVPQHALAKTPVPGDRLVIKFLMGQVISTTSIA